MMTRFPIRVRSLAVGLPIIVLLGWMILPVQARKKTPPPDPVPIPGVPDLTIDGGRIAESAFTESLFFKRKDCAVVEGCVNGPGERLLLRFDVATPNIGEGDLVLGNPADPNNPNADLFEYSPCHGHYHFSGYAKYELLNAPNVVVTGRKQAFCLEDFEKFNLGAGEAKYTCDFQGISVGWQDVYRSSLDCQWLDITDVLPGEYELRVTIDPDEVLGDANYGNNTAYVFLTLNNDGTISVP